MNNDFPLATVIRCYSVLDLVNRDVLNDSRHLVDALLHSVIRRSKHTEASISKTMIAASHVASSQLPLILYFSRFLGR